MSARYGIWFAIAPEDVAGLTDRLSAALCLEFKANSKEETVTAVGAGVSWDLTWGYDLEDDRDMPLSRYPVVLEFRPWSPMADAAQLDVVRGLFDVVRGWGVSALLIWDVQRLVDRIDAG